MLFLPESCTRLILLVVAVASLTAPILAADSGDASDATAEAPLELGDALALVNGAAIERAEFDRQLARTAAYSRAAHSDTFALDLLNRLIEQELIMQYAAAIGLDIEREVEEEFRRLKAELTSAAWEIFLNENLFTEAEFRSALRLQFTTDAVRDHVTAYLDGQVEHVRARHILVSQQSEARAVLRRLAAGESFSALAAEFSLDVSTRDYGGDLGWFIRGELLDQNLSDAAFAQNVGEIGGPIATRLGYHILQVMAVARRSIEPGRRDFLVDNIFRLWLDAQIESAEIIFNLEGLKALGAANP